MSYCDFVKDLDCNNKNKLYHDLEYGFPIEEDDELFGRLILEINQAGLSWTTILNKKDSIREAYSNFSIEKIALYADSDKLRLLSNTGIIRNKLKIKAVIHNAQVILKIQKESGSFKHWLDQNHPLTKNEWIKLFKETFKFTGGEITNEFLMSTGYLEGAHQKDCPIYQKVIKCKPKWLE